MKKLFEVSEPLIAPVAAVVFFAMWCWGEAGRMSAWPLGFIQWTGFWPLLMTTAAIAVARWKPYASLGLMGVLILGQFLRWIPPMESNYWAVYLGIFVAFGIIVWTGTGKQRWVASVMNLVFVMAMTVQLISWRYGDGVGWHAPLNSGDRGAFRQYGWMVFAALLVIAFACGGLGFLLALYRDQIWLRESRNEVKAELRETEIGLIIEEERNRIARDLHDVLAHSLAVIAAQADGARYAGGTLVPEVSISLENISAAARSALTDAQRVIEGVESNGELAPAPQLADVVPLVATMEQGSLKISRSESGRPGDLSSGQQLSVYRIVQECLTNVLKHGGRDCLVRLHLDWSGPGF